MLTKFFVIFLFVEKFVWNEAHQQNLRLRDTYGMKMLSYMDTSVNPCDDFYKYACGNYFNVNKVKNGFKTGDTFIFTRNDIIEDVHMILSEDTDNTTQGGLLFQKTKAIYQACMNTNLFDFQKSETYLKFIESLGGWPVIDPKWNAEDFDWFETITKLKEYGVDVLFKETVSELVIGIEPDRFGLIPLNPVTIMRPYSRFFQANKEIAHKIMKMYGATESAAKIAFQEIIDFGKEVIRAQSISKIYENSISTHTIESLDSFDPLTYDWQNYFSTIFGENANKSIEVLVKSEDYLEYIPMAFRQKYLRGAANYIFLKYLFMVHTELDFPRYHKRFCFDYTEQQMQPFLSVFYMRSKYYSTGSRDGISNMMSYIKNSLSKTINSSNWIDEGTKEKALRKLQAMKYFYMNESDIDLDEIERKCCLGLEVYPDDYFGNDMRLRKYEQKINHRYFISTLDNDITDDLLLPLKVNAFYDNSNEVYIFPGIMRMPFFNKDLPMAYNFGAIGRILGHEITHAFDYDGRKLDENGESTDWWSPESAEHYEERAKCFVEQYNNFKIWQLDAYIDGQQTLEENIADNGGLRQAYQAYSDWLNEHPEAITDEILPGFNFTNIQQFFISYGQLFCQQLGWSTYKWALKEKHAPNEFRLIGSLRNFDKFSETFNCDLATPMNPIKKCILW